MKGTLCPIIALVCVPILPTYADIIAQWNFNSVPPDGSASSGRTVASAGIGTASLINGTTATFSTGSTNDPATSFDDSGWNTAGYPAQGTNNKTAGVQFAASTLAYSNIVVRWDLRVSSTASKYYRLQYTTDGSTFIDYPTAVATLAVVSTGSYYEAQTNDLSAISGVNNNPDFAVRIVSEFQSSALGSDVQSYVTTSGTNNYSSSGTVRYDLVTISGTPIPGGNTPPTISSLTNQTIRVNLSGPAIPFTIGDAQDLGSSLDLSKASSDANVIPPANITFGGAGNDRTVTVTANNQTGSAVITVYVIDSGGRSNSASFTVSVLPANTAPLISAISPTNTLIDNPSSPIGFTLSDLETAADGLTLSASSLNPGLVPVQNIEFGGADSNRTAIVTPAAGQIGVAPLMITVSDGTNTASSSFALMVTPSANVIFYEPFTYADGSVFTNSAGLWDNRSGTFGQAQVTNGQLFVTTSQSEDVVAPLIGAPYNVTNGIILYASFKATFLSLPKAVPEYFAHFSSGSALRARVYAGTTNAPAGSFRFQVGNGSDVVNELPTNVSTNVTYRIVTRYNVDNAATTLWLNPTVETDPSATASDTQSATRIVAYGFRQDSGLGATLLVDDVQVGLSFDSVLSTNSPVTRIPLQLQLAAGKVILTWTDPSFTLQSASAVSAVYTNVPGATSPYTNTITGPAKFFRLKAN
jgi:hypothetical protein